MLFYRDIVGGDEMGKSLFQQIFNACALSQSGMVFTANQNAIHHIKLRTNNGTIIDRRRREDNICFTVSEKILRGFIRCQNIIIMT